MYIPVFTKKHRNYIKPIIDKKFYNSTFNTQSNVFEKYIIERKENSTCK